MTTDVPPRISWAIDLLDVQPDDRILEIGCGPGVGVGLVCERLGEGQITGIDRSATAIARAKARNAEHVAAGRALLQRVELAGFWSEPGRFDKAFAVNVNVFWTGRADAEGTVLRSVLQPGGVVRLVYGGPPPGSTRDVAPIVAANLERHGFTTEVTRLDVATCISGRRRRA
jgi:SAM-dependent methyltransferase